VNSLEEHVNRIEDMISCEKEPVPPLNGSQSSLTYDLTADTLRLEQVSFRYDPTSAWVLQGCEISLAPGRMTVICGQSGIGKTTVLKIALGLVTPVQGEVRVSSQVISDSERLSLRRHCAAVLQNDSIFMGSIRDNIAFFDVAPDEDWIHECARMACIDELVQTLPMKYGSLIGKDGAGFSAGQIQRFMLARALYRRPELLVLDEFSSHLDEITEKAIIQNLKATHITILTAAHRANVIDSADVVFEIVSGRARRVR
jgi:ATP-binding cassette subfamily B protein RaxB